MQNWDALVHLLNTLLEGCVQGIEALLNRGSVGENDTNEDALESLGVDHLGLTTCSHPAVFLDAVG